MLIYKITNKINGKVYIGQTLRTLDARWKAHCNDAIYHNSNNLFHNAIVKYGIDAFIIEELCKADTQEELDALECQFINQLKSLSPDGYNLKTGGQNGCQFSLESREKMSKAKIGTTLSEETKDRMSKTHLERWKSEELRQKKSESSKKAWEDPEYRETISKARTEYWSDPANRDKMSQKAKEFTTDEQKAKISIMVKESHHRPEVQEKLKEHHKNLKIKVVDHLGNIYNSLKEAAELNNCNSSTIIHSIKKTKTRGKPCYAGHKLWDYYDEENIETILKELDRLYKFKKPQAPRNLKLSPNS